MAFHSHFGSQVGRKCRLEGPQTRVAWIRVTACAINFVRTYCVLQLPVYFCHVKQESCFRKPTDVQCAPCVADS